MNLRTRRPAPLPGTGFPSRGLFLSRLTGLLAPVKGASPKKFDPSRCNEGVLDALFAAGQCGWTIYICGNEDAVAYGKTSDDAWQSFDAELCAHLKSLGIPLKRHYACLDAVDGKGRHKHDSVFRFPNTGAFYHAQQEDGIELRSSWILSGDPQELAAAWRAGVRCARIGAAPSGGELFVECEREGSSATEILTRLVATQRALT